jgi:hypothetical protein
VGEQVARGTTPELFKLFCQLAGNAELPVWHQVGTRSERFNKTIGRFEEDRCGARVACFLERPQPLSAFHGQEPAITKPTHLQSRSDERRRDRRNSRNDCEGELAIEAAADQSRAGIRKAGHTGVADERDRFAGGQTLGQFGGSHRFVVFVVTDEWFPDSKMAKQVSGVARVFCCDQVN